MQLKDVLVALALPALAVSAPTPQDPPPFVENPESDDSSIVGGVAASSGDFPFIISLQTTASRHFCGGSLLNANTVLTAAHCVDGLSASSAQVRAGSLNYNSGGTVARISSIRIHPNYDPGDGNQPDSENFDAAILKLSTSIATSSTISYARLSSADPASGTVHTVAGWGVTSQGGSTVPVALRKVDVPVVSRATCQANYPSKVISTNMYCAGLAAGGKDSCQGDSGGPIVNTSTRILEGVVSWGFGCAQPNLPGVYARVSSSSIASFISSNL